MTQPFSIPLARDDEIYLYVQTLPVTPNLYNQFTAVLNSEEQQRAERYHFKRDRNRFVVARGLLRYVLSAYLNKSPADIVFHYGSQGKPVIVDTTLQFNVSHSEDRILIGISRHHPVGVDVEYIARAVEIADIAARFFTENESKQIQALKGEAQRRAFFNVWTRKEALLKAIGSGLSFSLQACEVSVGTEAISEIVACDVPSFDIYDWQVHSRVLDDNYLAAAVVHKDLKVVWVPILTTI